MQCDANTLTVSYPALPDSVARGRRELSSFAEAAGADERQVESIRLAVSEAMTNAVLHAYREGGGEVHLTAALVSDELWVLVADDGCGLEPRTDRPGLGLGLAIMSQVSEEMAVVPRASGGTEVRMRFALVDSHSDAPSCRGGGIATGLLDGGPARSAHCRVGRRARRPA